MALCETLFAKKLISRKIWVVENFSNLHTVIVWYYDTYIIVVVVIIIIIVRILKKILWKLWNFKKFKTLEFLPHSYCCSHWQLSLKLSSKRSKMMKLKNIQVQNPYFLWQNYAQLLANPFSRKIFSDLKHKRNAKR